MTDYASLPSGVLAKIAQIEAHCLTLTTQLEHSRRDLQRLRIERRDCVPQTVHDEYAANRESERVLAEWARLDDAIAAQIGVCEAQEHRLRGQERVVRDCKTFLHELPAGAQLAVMEGRPGDLDAIRARIKQVRDEISQVQLIAVPSDDLAARIRHYVDALAARAAPVVRGIADGQALNVFYPLHDHADRVTLDGFAQAGGNPLLLLAFVQPERLAERLTQTALDAGIPAGERNQRLNALQQELTALRYDEEVSIYAALERGDGDVSRSASSPPWAVLMVAVEHEQQAAA